VGFEDLSGPVAVGEIVEVYESESGVAGEGRVTEIDGERELVYLSVEWSSLAVESIPSYEETSAVTTQLLFVGASTLTTSAPYESWIGLVARPSLVGIGGGNEAIWVTAPIYESSGLLLDSLADPYAEMWQINVNVGNATGVAA
jgi:hypothetical protein